MNGESITKIFSYKQVGGWIYKKDSRFKERQSMAPKNVSDRKLSFTTSGLVMR